jgi:uncharacterized membrane protein YqjE
VLWQYVLSVLGSVRRVTVTRRTAPSTHTTDWQYVLCVLGAVWRVTQSHTAQHPVHTLQTEAHITTAQQQF